MIVIVIIAILAAIALPAYQDYLVRAKVSEAVLAGDACKTSVAEFYQSQGHLPPNVTSASPVLVSVSVSIGLLVLLTALNTIRLWSSVSVADIS